MHRPLKHEWEEHLAKPGCEGGCDASTFVFSSSGNLQDMIAHSRQVEDLQFSDEAVQEQITRDIS